MAEMTADKRGQKLIWKMESKRTSDKRLRFSFFNFGEYLKRNKPSSKLIHKDPQKIRN